MSVEGYPRREKYFAHRLTRLLFKSCACQDIGHQAVCLITHIAHTEDAARYQGPVRFWNSQLMETLGFKSPKQLNNARDAAMKYGWLHYQRDNDRAVGRYWTVIPPHVEKFDDQPIEVPEIIRSENGKHSENGMHCGTGSGKPSIPIPNPNPASCSEPSADDSEPAEGIPPFPVVGGSRQWVLPAFKLAEWQATYEGLNVHREVLKARQWCVDNKRNRKTANGMPKFLNGWLAREQNSGRSADRRGKPATASPADSPPPTTRPMTREEIDAENRHYKSQVTQ